MRACSWPAAAACLLALAGPLFAQAGGTSQSPSSSGSLESTPPIPAEVGGRTLAQWMADLKHPDPSKRAEALISILGFGPGAMDAVPAIIDRCRDGDASPRAKAVIVLKLMQVRERDIPKIVDALARRLTEDPQTIIRYEAAQGLVRYAEEAHSAIPALIRGMEDAGCWEIRHACIIALRRAAYDPKNGPDHRATQALIRSLRDPVSKVRMEATLSLGALGAPRDPQLLTAVVSALQGQLGYKDKILSLWTHVSLMAIDDKVTDKSLEAILKLLQSPERDIRVQALVAFGALGPKARTCVPAVVDALHDKETDVVIAACAALPRMGDRSSRVLDPLIKVSQRKEQHLVYAACAALGEIGNTSPDILAALTAVTQRKELDDALIQSVRRILEEVKKPKK
jgi:HEAT repeat protein